MKLKFLSLLFLVIFAVFATSAAFYVSSAETVDENVDLTEPYSIVLTDGEGVEPDGKPIDTPGMPT